MTIADFTRMLTGALRERPCRRVLYVAQDVADALSGHLQASPGPVTIQGVLGALAGIEVVVAGDAAPGSFRFVRHDGCEVKDGTSIVSHEKCTIAAEGQVDLLTRPYQP